MGVEVYLRDERGRELQGLADPAGGTFDAAGNFDRLVPRADDETYPCWRAVDRDETTVFFSQEMPAFLLELARIRMSARSDLERRGLDRLRVMAERCLSDSALALWFCGD